MIISAPSKPAVVDNTLVRVTSAIRDCGPVVADSGCLKLFGGMELLSERDSMLDYQFCCTLNRVHDFCTKKTVEMGRYGASEIL